MRRLLVVLAIVLAACGPRTVTVDLDPIETTTTSVAPTTTTAPAAVDVAWEATAFDLHGVVRLEAPSGPGLEAARELADLSARELPRFASDPARDPRAPQNLLPIGALETRLKHRLGDHAVIRRAIEARLHEEAVA